jgi:hypothetical protein
LLSRRGAVTDTGKPRGYVVVSSDDRCLGKDFRWHDNSPREAFVHSTETVLEAIQNGGRWLKTAKEVIPAQYNAEIDFTELTGESIVIWLFLVDVLSTRNVQARQTTQPVKPVVFPEAMSGIRKGPPTAP